MLVPMDIMERVIIMRVVNKNFVKSVENTIKRKVLYNVLIRVVEHNGR